MKLIAITPDNLDEKGLKSSLKILKKNGASHLYVRSPFILASSRFKDTLRNTLDTGIVPIIPYKKWLEFKDSAFVGHFKEREKKEIEDFKKEFPGSSFSFSAHSVKLAEQVLNYQALFVFISPVYSPFSKKDYNLKPLNFKDISYLANTYGDRVVLLGGIDFERIKELKLKLRCDFSVAGITMFFREALE